MRTKEAAEQTWLVGAAGGRVGSGCLGGNVLSTVGKCVLKTLTCLFLKSLY